MSIVFHDHLDTFGEKGPTVTKRTRLHKVGQSGVVVRMRRTRTIATCAKNGPMESGETTDTPRSTICLHMHCILEFSDVD